MFMVDRDLGFWVVMLIGFYFFFCKFNLVLKFVKDYDFFKFLLCKDIIVCLWGLVICVIWFKII